MGKINWKLVFFGRFMSGLGLRKFSKFVKSCVFQLWLWVDWVLVLFVNHIIMGCLLLILERDWIGSQDTDLSGRVFRHIHWMYPRLLIPGVYVCRSDCLFVLWLECIALAGNGVCLLHGCISLKRNEQARSTWFEILFAPGKGLTSRHNLEVLCMYHCLYFKVAVFCWPHTGV